MAFNPFITFQKNRRFWMAAILMICMISFVFCTGMKGDMADRLAWIWGGGKGASAFTIDGRSYTTQQINDLRTQRKLASKLMINCSDMAFQKLQKEFFELGKKGQGPAGGKEGEAIQQRLAQILVMRESIALRKARSNYFELGTKFDDLVEFALWQNIADKLGIRLEEKAIDHLFYWEFFNQLSAQELSHAEGVTLRDFRDVSHAFVRRAISEEFRVRIAQEAIMTAQPFPFFGRKRQQEGGLAPKFTNPDVPDEIRAPMTMATLWDSYKKNRAEFDVTLLPISVSDFLAKVKAEPREGEKEEYFKVHREKAVDPSSDVHGLQIPQRIRIEFVMADPTSPAYLESAKLVDRLKVTSPFAPDVTISPLAALTRYWAADKRHHQEMQDQYDALPLPTDKLDYRTAPVNAKDCTTPALMWFARKHPEAAASLIGGPYVGPIDPIAGLANFMAWGAAKHPEELELTLRAESKRRAPHYAGLVGVNLVAPLGSVGTFIALEMREADPRVGYPRLPLEAIQKELEDMLARRAAEEKAQANMQIVRAALDKADGDAEKFKRELNKLVPELKLTYSSSADKKNVFVNRYTVNDSKELEPLKEAFLKYVDMINFFEGRDVTPERLLKPTDFLKMFFEGEPFAATSPHRAMPWPPRVKANTARVWKQQADPRLIDASKMDLRARAAFEDHLKQQNPLAPAPMFDDLFKNAAKPILFWRTGKHDPDSLPDNYAKIAPALQKIAGEWNERDMHRKKQVELTSKIEALRKQEAKAKADPDELKRLRANLASLLKSLRKLEEDAGGNATFLRLKQTDLKEKEADLREIERRVVEGWKFERARATEAIPTAKQVAETLIKNGNQGIHAQADKLNVLPFSLDGMCRMYPEKMPDLSIDYGKPPLPKDKISFPRDDMIDQVISLYDLSESIKIDHKELDDINKELFDLVRKGENPRGHYVQILTNKPRSIYYVAFVSRLPVAKRDAFVLSLIRAPHDFEGMPMQFGRAQRDRFVERVQQQDARDYRRTLVSTLKAAYNYSLDDPKAKETIDGAVGD